MKRRSLAALGGLCCWSTLSLLPIASAAPTPTPPPSAVGSALEDGGKRLAADDTAGAIRSLQAAVRAEPDSAEAAHLLTVAYLHAGQLDHAVSAAQAEVDRPAVRSEDRARAALLLGAASYSLLMKNLKAVDGQISSFDSMKLLLQQMAPHTHMLPTGDVVTDPGDEGLQSESIALNSSIKDTVAGLQKTLAQSEGAFRLALSIDPNLPGAHDGLGLVRAAQGYVGEARSEFLAEIRANGASGQVYLHLAEVQLLQHEDEDAAGNLRLAAALMPDCEAPYHDLALMYERHKDNDGLQWARGMSALKHGDAHAAQAAFARSSRRSADLLCAEALLALQQKRPDDARALLTQARTLDAHNAETMVRLGDLDASLGHYHEALASYQHALELDAACGAAWYGIGLAYDALNDRESAVSDFRQALQISPNDPSIRLHLADDEAELGQNENSVSDFSDYLRRFPTASDGYLVLTALSLNQAAGK